MTKTLRLDREYKVHLAVMERLPLTGALVTDVVERNGRDLFLVGESHETADSVDYTHRVIVPKIQSGPESWLMLREGADAYPNSSERELLYSHPSFLYFQKLPAFLGIPVDDAVGSITSRQNQDLIASGSDVTIDEMRGWYITNFVNVNRGFMTPSKMKEACAGVLGVTIEDLDRAAQYANNREVHERLMTAWNEVSRGELDRILEEYPDRRNVLVSVGAGHLPAFSDRHGYIG